MKSDFHFHFYSRIIIMLILAVSLLMIQRSVTTLADEASTEHIRDWAWNSLTGWISLNCENDYDMPGVYEERCAAQGGIDYGLYFDPEAAVPLVEGCAWGGNTLNNGTTTPLGWVCFSDPVAGVRPDAADGFGVATSTTYLNALDPNTYASIVQQQFTTCLDPIGQRCARDSDCNSLGCQYWGPGSGGYDYNEAWKLGFPISDPVPAGTDPDVNDGLLGCFNCYRPVTKACSASGDPCDVDSDCSLFPLETCDQSLEDFYKCDNCLEYAYYDGRCEEVDGTGSHIYCENNEDCTFPETCSPISFCSNDIELDCTDNASLCGDPDNCIERDVGSLKKVIGGYDCDICEGSVSGVDPELSCAASTYRGNLNSCNSCQYYFYTPGVMIDHEHYDLESVETARLCGWGWNAWDDGGDIQGLGWFQFAPRVVTSTRAYVSAENGNIYSQKNISGKYLPPFGYSNASYLIESGGSITNFISSSTLSGTYQAELPYRPIISFFEENNGKYSNALGTIDYGGLVNDFDEDLLSHVNKYGATVKSFVAAEGVGDLSDTGQLMNGEVYYYRDGLYLEESFQPIFSEGSGNEDASGVIVVDGDLTILGGTYYESGGNYSNLKNIPSVVWVVKGDLLIGPSVSNLAGTFVVLGDSSIAPDCDPIVASCGRIVTCYLSGATVSCDDRSLSIEGNVLARYFDLGRTYASSTDPVAAERFVNTGRLQANPPVGFEDFSKLIPRFTEN